MSWHRGGEVRCASVTYAGRFVIEVRYCIDQTPLSLTLSGNSRQRRRVVRSLRRFGYIVTRGGVGS